MIVDANILLYAADSSSAHHERAAAWLTAQLNGDRRVGLPWSTLGAFLRIVTHPRVAARPLTADAAQAHVDAWLAADPVWIPAATERTMHIYARIARAHAVTGNLVPDALLAALAVELGVEIVSADTDFARFTEVRWVNPLVP